MRHQFENENRLCVSNDQFTTIGYLDLSNFNGYSIDDILLTTDKVIVALLNNKTDKSSLIVYSGNYGITWNKLIEVNGLISVMDYDPGTKYLFYNLNDKDSNKYELY